MPLFTFLIAIHSTIRSSFPARRGGRKMKKDMSNFAFLASKWLILANLGELAEEHAFSKDVGVTIK
jgi:hypothetical protein